MAEDEIDTDASSSDSDCDSYNDDGERNKETMWHYIYNQLPQNIRENQKKGCLTEKGIRLFTDWFNSFKDPETGIMGQEQFANFYSIVTALKGDEFYI